MFKTSMKQTIDKEIHGLRCSSCEHFWVPKKSQTKHNCPKCYRVGAIAKEAVLIKKIKVVCCENCEHKFQPKTLIKKPVCPKCKRAC